MTSRVVISILSVICFAGCATKPWDTRPCLRSGGFAKKADASTSFVSERARANERIQRKWKTAHESEDWAAQVCAWESISGDLHRVVHLFPVGQEPACEAELSYELEDIIFAQQPIEFSRLQLARIVAAGTASDLVEVMPGKATLLLRLAKLGDSEIGSYQRHPDEVSAAPPKEIVRALARRYLARSNLYLNDARVRRYLWEAEAGVTHGDDMLLLRRALYAHFFSRASRLRGAPAGELEKRTLARWLSDARARLERGFDPVSFELLLLTTEAAGQYGRATGLGTPAQTLLERILDADVALPAVADRRAERYDLHTTAAHAAYFLSLPASEREVLDAWDRPPRQSRSSPVAHWAERWRQQGPLLCHSTPAPRASEASFPDWLRPTHVSATPAHPAADQAARRLAGVIAQQVEWLEDDALRDWVLRRAAHRAGGPSEPLDLAVIQALDAALARPLSAVPKTAASERALRRLALQRVFEDLVALLEGRETGADRAKRGRTSYDFGQAWIRSIHLLGRHADAHGFEREMDQLLAGFAAHPRYKTGRRGIPSAVAWARIARSAVALAP